MPRLPQALSTGVSLSPASLITPIKALPLVSYFRPVPKLIGFLETVAMQISAVLAVAFTLTLPALSQSATEQTLYSFTSNISSGPAAMIQASDGNFYAATTSLTVSGGWDPSPRFIPGSFLQITPSGSVTLIATISQKDVTINSLLEGMDGNFYGVSSTGGSGNGFVFSLTSAGTFTVLYNFTGASDGGSPTSLIQTADGTFYGTTESGGYSDNGVIFHYSLAAGMQTFYTFAGIADSGSPESILQGSDGNFYGTAAGSNGPGAVFKMTSSGTLTLLYSFGADDSQYPFNLAEGSDGNFYGLLSSGATVNYGSFFRVTSAGAGTILHDFSSQESYAWQLLQGSDGNFFGVTETGGVNGSGAFLQMTPGGVVNVLYSFSSPGQQDGAYPLAAVQGSNGNFYGISVSGGADGDGTVFEISPATSLAAPARLSLSASSISLGETVTLTWSLSNAHSLTDQTCFATAPTGAGNWTGVQFGSTLKGMVGGAALITPTAEGNFTYSITCGGVESAVADLLVTNAASKAVNLSSTDENLGEVADGKTKTVAVTVTNDTGAAFPFSISMYGDANFSENNTCGTSIGKNKSCKIMIAYAAPTGTNETDGAQFVIASNGASFAPGNEIFVSATASPAGKVKLSATNHNFGTVKPGTSSSFGLNVTNNANGPAVLSYSTGTIPPQYTVNNACPGTLAAGDECVVTFTFTPTDTSTQSLTFTVTPSSPHITAGSITLIGN